MNTYYLFAFGVQHKGRGMPLLFIMLCGLLLVSWAGNYAAAQDFISLDYAASTKAPIGAGISFVNMKQAGFYINSRFSTGVFADHGSDLYTTDEAGNLSDGFSKVHFTGNDVHSVGAITIGLTKGIPINPNGKVMFISYLGAGYGWDNLYKSFQYSYNYSSALPGMDDGLAKLQGTSITGLQTEAGVTLKIGFLGLGVGFTNLGLNTENLDVMYRVGFFTQINSPVN